MQWWEQEGLDLGGVWTADRDVEQGYSEGGGGRGGGRVRDRDGVLGGRIL